MYCIFLSGVSSQCTVTSSLHFILTFSLFFTKFSFTIIIISIFLLFHLFSDPASSTLFNYQIAVLPVIFQPWNPSTDWSLTLLNPDLLLLLTPACCSIVIKVIYLLILIIDVVRISPSWIVVRGTTAWHCQLYTFCPTAFE